MYTVKVAVVGPSQAGKTMISNFLADATENIGGDMMMNATTESLGEGGHGSVQKVYLLILKLLLHNPDKIYSFYLRLQ